MIKYRFLDDYSEGCHPEIIKAMADTNMSQQTAYGNDVFSEEARKLIRQHIGKINTPIYFVAGGTLANVIIMSSALGSHEAVFSASTGHIVVRETGAIEATGHKIITVPSNDGKLSSDGIEIALANNAHYPHMAKPSLAFISNATEIGTVYTKSELTALFETCKANDLLLLLDRARYGAWIRCTFKGSSPPDTRIVLVGALRNKSPTNLSSLPPVDSVEYAGSPPYPSDLPVVLPN